MKPRVFLSLSLALITALPASAQFAGSDFFTGSTIDTSLWTGPNQIAGNGTFTLYTIGSGGKQSLSFLSGGTSSEVATLVWRQTNATNIDWPARLGAWLPQWISLSTAGQHIEIGLMVWPTNSSFTGSMPDNFFSFSLDTYNPTGTGVSSVDQVRDVYTSSKVSGGTISKGTAAPISQTGAELGLTYSSAAHTIYASYRTDLSASFTPLSSFDTLASWPLMDTFSIGIFASSSGFPVLPSNNVQATGFQVGPSAIPEPSTYAVLLGATALLFAILRRRRTA